MRLIHWEEKLWYDPYELAEEIPVGEWLMMPTVLVEALQKRVAFHTTQQGGGNNLSWRGTITFQAEPSPLLRELVASTIHGHWGDNSPTEWWTTANTRVAHEGTAERIALVLKAATEVRKRALQHGCGYRVGV